MTIEYINKDITTVGYGVVAHGCNCSMGFGTGVAGAIKKKWPEVYNEFLLTPGMKMLGRAQIFNLDPMCEALWVVNCYTQQAYGYDGARYASAEAIRTSMTQVMEHAVKHSLPVYIPKIGCGRGGLDWEAEVKPIINQLSEQFSVKVFVCEWNEFAQMDKNFDAEVNKLINDSKLQGFIK